MLEAHSHWPSWHLSPVPVSPSSKPVKFDPFHTDLEPATESSRDSLHSHLNAYAPKYLVGNTIVRSSTCLSFAMHRYSQ